MARVVEVIGIHVADQLLEHEPLQDLTQYGQDCYWPVTFGIKFASLTFVQRNNLGNFPFRWKLFGLDGQVDNVTDRRNNDISSEL